MELSLRAGSLSAAAEILAITPAAVGQRIKTLEDHLGFALIARGRTGIHPTRDLEAAMPHLDTAFRELDKAAEIMDLRRAHEIHIVADTDWAELWLQPRLAGFRADNPNVHFCINGVGDVPARIGRPDCEIWIGKGRGRNDEAELFRDYLLPVSSPRNSRRLLSQPCETCLEGFPLIHLTPERAGGQPYGWPEWVQRHGHRETAPERGVRYTRAAPALEGVRSDVGLLICGLGLILDAFDAGDLALPFEITEGVWHEGAYRISFREGAGGKPQIARFRDWLIAEGQATQLRLGTMTGSAPA